MWKYWTPQLWPKGPTSHPAGNLRTRDPFHHMEVSTYHYYMEEESGLGLGRSVDERRHWLRLKLKRHKAHSWSLDLYSSALVFVLSLYKGSANNMPIGSGTNNHKVSSPPRLPVQYIALHYVVYFIWRQGLWVHKKCSDACGINSYGSCQVAPEIHRMTHGLKWTLGVWQILIMYVVV